MAKLPRIMVKRYLEPVSFDGPVSTIQELLAAFVVNYPEYSSLHIEGDFLGYDGGKEYHLYGARLENDEEYEIRVAMQRTELNKKKLVDQKKLEKERKEYERLRKKFEKQ